MGRNANSPPWKRDNPQRPSERATLTSESRRKARLRAARAGRPYPNLVDNMRAAADQKKRSRKRK